MGWMPKDKVAETAQKVVVTPRDGRSLEEEIRHRATLDGMRSMFDSYIAWVREDLRDVPLEDELLFIAHCWCLEDKDMEVISE